MWGDREKYRSYTDKQYTQALDMYFKDKIGVREIAKILKMPRSTVGSWVYALKKLNAPLTHNTNKLR